MYSDDVQSYGAFNLETYHDGENWVCSWWDRMMPDIEGKSFSRRRKDAVSQAKRQIKEYLWGRGGLFDSEESNDVV